ncbi:MAG: hypothetical protein EOM62_18270 [Bacteroidia bacterium]|nr:hypothetical protein [Bacteroidia bacterium]
MPTDPSAMNRKPLPLKANERFATYQFYATLSGKQSPEKALVVAVLYTLAWLRERFQEIEVPPELNTPPPTEADSFSRSQLRSFRISVGYSVEVVWLSQEGIWALQLTEPDLGDGHPRGRPAVPGRIFETNIAFHLRQNDVELGFRTLVSQPLNTTAPCEVYRPAVIKELVRSSGLKLFQQYPITESCTLLKKTELGKFMGWLKSNERTLPVVVARTNEAQPPAIRPDSASVLHTLPEFSPLQRPGSPLQIPLPTVEEHAFCGELQDLPRLRMGYAQFFVLPAACIAEFKRVFKDDLAETEIKVYPVIKNDMLAPAKSFHLTASNKKNVREQILAYLQESPIHHPNQFGGVAFLEEAKTLEREALFHLAKSKEDVQRIWAEKMQAAQENYDKQRQELHYALTQTEEKKNRLKEELSQAERTIQSLQEEYKYSLQALQQRDEENKQIVEWYLSQRNWPKAMDEVAPWVEKQMDGRLMLHSKAQRLLKAESNSDVDLYTLCCALEYLANEYRDFKMNLYDSFELTRRCERKYGRPFEITRIADATTSKYPVEYKIKYGKSVKGKSQESVLNLHLKIGTDAERLIRIYFLWDAEENLIVVGSLPAHLPTINF